MVWQTMHAKTTMKIFILKLQISKYQRVELSGPGSGLVMLPSQTIYIQDTPWKGEHIPVSHWSGARHMTEVGSAIRLMFTQFSATVCLIATTFNQHWVIAVSNVVTSVLSLWTKLVQCWVMHAMQSQQTHNICITFEQWWTNVEDVGPTLSKCYTIVLCVCYGTIFPEIEPAIGQHWTNVA